MAFRDEQMRDLYDEGHTVFSISKHNNRLFSLKALQVCLYLVVSLTIFWLGKQFQNNFFWSSCLRALFL